MSAVVSLRHLQEPAYVLLGGLVPDDGSGAVRVLRSGESVVEYPSDAAEAAAYFSRLRSRSDAVAAVTSWGGDAADLDALVDDGTLVCLPAGDESRVRAVLAPLGVLVPSPATLADDGLTVWLTLPDGRRAGISTLTAAVLSAAEAGVGAGVRMVADGAGLDSDAVWRSTVHDLTTVLSTGAGYLIEAPS